MEFHHSLFLLLAIFLSLTSAQQAGDVGKVLGTTFTELNLTILSRYGASFANESLQILQKGGNLTFLAPIDSAFKGANSLAPEDVSALLAYHLVNASLSYNDLAAAPGPRLVAQTAYGPPLFNSSLVNLLGQPQVVVVEASTGTGSRAEIQGHTATDDVKFVNKTDGPRIANLLIQPVNHLLSIPGNFSSVLHQEDDLSAIQSFLAKNQTMDILSSTPAVTFFAPENTAIAGASASLSKSTPEELANILANHVLNGTLAYSPWIQTNRTKWDQTSASGQPLKFRVAGNDTYVSSGDTEAKIIKADLLTSNGVIHIIDRVLINSQSNATAAAAAVNKARKDAASVINGQSGQGVHKDASSPSSSISAGVTACAVLITVIFFLGM